jgi:hypothetical protein
LNCETPREPRGMMLESEELKRSMKDSAGIAVEEVYY